MDKFNALKYLLLGIALMIISFPVNSNASQEINYQGRLTDDAGNPISGTEIKMVFTIYDGTGSPLWTSGEQFPEVTDGLFSYILGSSVPIPDEIFDTPVLYLGIKIGSDPEIVPRTKLTSVPKSAVAGNLFGSDVVTEEGGVLNIYNEIGKVIGFEPSPYNTARMEFFDPSGVMPNDPYIRMGTEPSPFNTGGFFKFLDPSHGPMLEIMANSLDGASIKMFQPQPEPPGKPFMEMIGDAGGAAFNMYSPASKIGNFGINLNAGAEEVGIIIVDSQPGVDSSSIDLGIGSEETGIIIVDSRPDGTSGNIDLRAKATETGIIIVDSRPDGSNGIVDIYADDTDAAVIIQNESSSKATTPSIALRANPDSSKVIIKGQTPPTGGEPPVISMLTRDDSAKVGIGTNTPSEALAVVGNIVATGSINEFTATKMKKNIVPIDNSLEIIAELNGVRYDWRSNEYPDYKFSDNRQIGLLAEDVEKVIPELVHADGDGNKMVAYTKLTAVLIEAIKEQQAKITVLEERLKALESR